MQGGGFVQRLVQTIIHNLHITLSDVHVRYEQAASCSVPCA